MRCSVSAAIALMAHLAAAQVPIDVTPYPVQAGKPVTIEYDPAGRPLQGSSPVYLHYGFNGWNPTTSPDPAMTWIASKAVWQITVSVPATATQLDVVFRNSSNVWDNNSGADWHILVIGGTSAAWTMDGERDPQSTLVASNGGSALYAGVRGTTLYLAASKAVTGEDHFLFVAGTPGALSTPPWSKAGKVAKWSAYVGNEGDNNWAGWTDAGGAHQVAVGTWLEATIDLPGELGSMPTQIYLAFAPYGTNSGDALIKARQAPASLDNDGDLDANEYVAVPISSIRSGCTPLDLDADCDVDAADYTVFAGCLAGPQVASCGNADLDHDGDVDLADYARYQVLRSGGGGASAIVAEDLGGNVTRFYAADVELGELPPSMSLAVTPVVNGPAAQPWTVQPSFMQSGDRQLAIIPVDSDVSLYGTGEVCGGLLRNGHTTEAWNTDAYGYGAGNTSLYEAHPWVLAVRPDGSAFGVLADTTYRCRIDLTFDIVFAAKGPQFPLYVFEGDSPQAVLTRLSDFIGRIEMPPAWALGFQQSRYSYAPDSVARSIASGFRTRHIPCDVIWFDIDYMNGYRVFTFSPTGYPNPASVNSDLHGMGYHTVWMIDPGVKAETGYFVADQGTAGDHWVYNSGGTPFSGQVWPGQCYFPDFTRPQTRSWWSGLYPSFMAQGIDGVWNDMNEPSVFDGPNHTMPEGNLHRGGGGLPAGTHAQYHNVYGMLMVQATRAGIQAANPAKRPFVLTRANFIGGQRYAATWTGDNQASWEHLYYATPMVLNMGLSGQPFAGPDIGGYAGDGTADLFARWMGVGVFMPFCRAHSDNQGVNKEPWSFGATVETACRTALQRRYRLLPYYYTLFHEASVDGLPVVRPVFFADPSDESLRSEDRAFLIGADVLVVPNVSENPASAPTPTLPAGAWRSITLAGENPAADVNQPDLRVREGAIVPLGPVLEYTNAAPLSPLTLVINLDAGGHAEGDLYEDAGDGFAYQAGTYRLAHYAATKSGNVVTISVVDREGSLPATSRPVAVQILTPTGVMSGSGSDGDGVVAVVNLP